MTSTDLPPCLFRQCLNPACGLRYPHIAGQARGERCPRCGAETRIEAQQSRRQEQPSARPSAPARPLEALLDNIRSAWNVGSMFRSADGLGWRRLHLAGITPTPDNPQVIKTALGAENSVAWCYHASALAAAQDLQREGARLWALEAAADAVLLDQVRPWPSDRPLVLIVGNEPCGIDPALLALCEQTVRIPMLGLKSSLNVAVAFGIAAYVLSSA